MTAVRVAGRWGASVSTARLGATPLRWAATIPVPRVTIWPHCYL